MALIESNSTTADWCGNYFHRQMALPGLNTSARNSIDSARLSQQSNPCCCHCHCNSGIPEARPLPYERCRVTELPDDGGTDIVGGPEGRRQMQTMIPYRSERNSYCNASTDVVPWRPPAPIRINRNPSSCSATNNGVSLVNYIRRSSSRSSSDNQNLTTQRNNQTNGNGHVAHVYPPYQHRGSRCHHACHHPSRPRPVISLRARSRERRTGMATMMPLSAWNLRRMQCPIPLEPPPPYRPWQLPPYLEDDPAPSYRSRSTTPANSVYAASD